MNTDLNPYQPPREDARRPRKKKRSSHRDRRWHRCPLCRSRDVEQPVFTWWGGAIGAKLLKHVKCQRCGHGFNGVTGKSNTSAIIAYQLVALVIVIGLIALSRM